MGEIGRLGLETEFSAPDRATKSDLFVLLMVPHHRGSGRATVSSRTRKEDSMCWSKSEREQWERERREAELEAERIRLVSATHKAAEPEPEVGFDEREEELVRG
jgi:hypothetical protein